MSGTTTIRMLAAYFQEGGVSSYFAGMFKLRPEGIHSSEEVEIDIVRSEEDVSIVIHDMSTGYRMNSADLYTNKGFKPPVHKEAVPINASSLIKRQPGENPFQSPDFRANLVLKMFTAMRKVQRKIQRAIELQASQVLQTGVVSLTDSAGNVLYTLDYKPKSSHFPTAGVSWATATMAQKIADLIGLCDKIRSDGLVSPDEITFGATAWENFIQTPGFMDIRFNSQRANLGSITPQERRGGGGIYRGTIEIGNYVLDVFTYDGRYKHPQTGVSTAFLHPGKIIVRAASGRLDATFGAIPNIGQLLGVGNSLLPELPGRMSSVEQGMDLFTNVWMSTDGETLFGGVGSRPLMIPVAIDTFGCLNTQLS